VQISDYLKEDLICLHLKADSKEKVIKELAEWVKKAEGIIDFEKFLTDVFKREEVSSTGIGEGIAIPHARTDAVSKFVIGVGRHSQGVAYNTPDQKPAQLFFLMGVPLADVSGYLKILARLTRLLKKISLREKLLKASSPGEVITAFKEAEVP
jgi:fructose-specific phosphotransferase system IIA component